MCLPFCRWWNQSWECARNCSWPSHLGGRGLAPRPLFFSSPLWPLTGVEECVPLGADALGLRLISPRCYGCRSPSSQDSDMLHPPHGGGYGFTVDPRGGICALFWPVLFFCPFPKSHGMNWGSYRNENEGNNILSGFKAQQSSHTTWWRKCHLSWFTFNSRL